MGRADAVWLVRLRHSDSVAGATNTPIACTVMGIELFGAGPLILLAVACVASYVVVGERGIYTSQRVDTAKATGGEQDLEESTLRAIAMRRRLWLPARYAPGVNADEATG